MLDLACGSGASTRALVNAAPHETSILGVDLSAGMLEIAVSKEWPSTVHFIQGEVGRLDTSDLGAQRWGGALAAYLFRNIDPSVRDAAVSEVYEVLEPDGWLVVQEHSVADSPRARLAWNVVSWLVIIPLGTILDRNPRLYRYLWRSVHSFDSTERFMSRLGKAGFVDVATCTAPGWQHGILHTFVARKPAR